MGPVIRLAALLILITMPAAAQCYDRNILAGYLTDRGMTLHSWGLTSGGNMQELFLSDSGEWAVIQTTPTGCATIASTPDGHHGRLWAPPQGNKAIPPPRRMTPGEAL